MAPVHFNPSPEVQAKVVDAFSDPSLSLRGIAAAHNTTLAALAAFISRPDIHAQLALRNDLSSQRVQFLAIDNLHSSIAAASSILSAFNSEEATLKLDPTTRAKRHDPAHDCRAHRSALHSASLLYRLSRPAPSRREASRTNSPAGPASECPAQSRHQREPSAPPATPIAAPAPAPALDLDTIEQALAQLEAIADLSADPALCMPKHRARPNAPTNSRLLTALAGRPP